MRFFLSVILCLFSFLAFSQTSLSGKVTDTETGNPIIFALVVLFKNGVLVTGTETDFDGFYSITDIEPGIYAIEFSYIDYAIQKIEKLEVIAGKSNKLDVKMRMAPLGCDFIWSPPLIEIDNTTQGMKLTSDQIRHLPFRGN